MIAAAQAIRSEPGFRPASSAGAASSGVAWMQVNQNGFGNSSNSSAMSLEVFGGQLYAGTANWAEGGQVWRTTDGTTWTAVSVPGFGSAYTTTNTCLLDMIAFNGQLYVSTAGWGRDGVRGQIWRSPNGTDWTQVEGAGFGDTGNTAIGTFAVFNNQLYVTTQSSNGLQIWRSSTGNSGDWSLVVDNGNGNANNNVSTSLIEFNGYLYAAVENGTDGAEIWRTDNGTTWTAVSSGGFGSADNIWTGSFAIFDGNLYVGTGNNATGGQIWRSNNGTTWTAVIGNGFGDPSNFKIESLMALDGALYAGTDNNVTGIEMWRSSNGATWTQVNTDGFGDSTNTSTLWSAGTVIFNDHLYIGTTNDADGGEVWTCYDTGTWSAVTSPVTYTLMSADMVSANDGWAVGYEGFWPNGTLKGSVLLRWEGNIWSNNWGDSSGIPLFAVAMVSASDVWAVGDSAGWTYHLDGNTWASVPRPGGLALTSVAMVSANDGWAVGGSNDCAYSPHETWGTILRWDGSAWSLVEESIPDKKLNSVALVSATDGWAVGYYCHYNGDYSITYDSVTMRWNGSSWNEVDTPTEWSLNSVAMVSATDGWAVGGRGVILHWNGSAWSLASSPTSCILRSVSMVSADDGWAVGGNSSSEYCSQPSVILHWNGNTWSETVSPVSETLNSVAMISADEGWAVGEAGTILHYTNLMNLSVSKTGSGSGTVTSNPAGIDCGATCSASFNYNTSVTLTATAITGSTFTGWSGSGCSGTGTCTVTMSAAKSVTANFSLDTYRIYLPLVLRNRP
jgi:hypothetical protein